MSKALLRTGLVGLVLTALVPVLALAATEESRWSGVVGTWKGTLSYRGQGLITVLHLKTDDVDELVGTMDSPEQSAFGLPITGGDWNEDGSFTIRFPNGPGTYTARLKDNDSRMVGEWSQRGVTIELECHRVIAASGPQPGQERLVGSWEGKLKVSEFKGLELRMVFHVKVDASGVLEGSFDSPDQLAYDIPFSQITISEDGNVSLVSEVGALAYEGSLGTDDGSITGHLLQPGKKLPLDLTEIDSVVERLRPQTPKPPFPYLSEDVSYRNEGADVTIAGTLTIPEGVGPFPAAILITGSGPQDRDETVFAHKPFLVIADYLTRHGIAVLRADDRGMGGTSQGSPGVNSLDFAGDVEAGMNYLTTRYEINKQAIGLIGHSEGGMIGPIVAVDTGAVAFLVLLAGPGLTGEEILLLQGALINRAAGMDEEAIEKNTRGQKEIFATIKDPSLTAAERKERLTRILRDLHGLTEEDEDDPTVETAVAMSDNAWMRFFLVYDPKDALEKVTCPVLAVNGEKDLQVPPEENLAAIEAALKKAGNTDVMIVELPALNHLFQTCETGAISEYIEIEQTFAPEVLEIMGDWINERFGVNRKG